MLQRVRRIYTTRRQPQTFLHIFTLVHLQSTLNNKSPKRARAYPRPLSAFDLAFQSTI